MLPPRPRSPLGPFSGSLTWSALARWAPVLAIVALATGCAPQIGDDCTTSLDCSQLGDRLCDTSQPDGYCTIFNCEPDACPDEAICIGFGLELDPACTSVDDPRWKRFERTFCMVACEEQQDCRPGYVCASPEERRAISIDIESELKGSKACFPKGEVAQASTAPPAACTP